MNNIWSCNGTAARGAFCRFGLLPCWMLPCWFHRCPTTRKQTKRWIVWKFINRAPAYPTGPAFTSPNDPKLNFFTGFSFSKDGLFDRFQEWKKIWKKEVVFAWVSLRLVLLFFIGTIGEGFGSILFWDEPPLEPTEPSTPVDFRRVPASRCDSALKLICS